MRVLAIVGAALIGGVSIASAQHGHQLELGGYGTFTRFDQAFGLKNTIGGGGRIGFFLSDFFGLEGNADFGAASPTAGGTALQVKNFGGSLILNSGGEHNVLYVLAGYTRLNMGANLGASTSFNEVHAGIGDRIFFGNHVALRLEVRGSYAPNDTVTGNKNPFNVTGSLGLSFLLGGGGGGGGKSEEQPRAPEMPKETRDSIIAAGGAPPAPPTPEKKPTRQVFVQSGLTWPHQWFWGAQGGLFVFKTTFDGISAEPIIGGHWLVTGKRTALYIGAEQAFFLTDRHATIVEPSGAVEPGNVAFNNVRRYMIGILGFPVQKAVQPFAGGGFAIMEVQNPTTTCTNCSITDGQVVQNAAFDAATKAFFWWMAGIDIRQGRLSLFGHYMLTTSASNFLISSVTHTFQGGLRYSFGTAREDVTEQH